ncbi:MAG: hypothetical protein P3B98_11605, partial [Gemmatimonadota bacterium]|nr:hypothetical protein [Gemmatimonadota bacterium]
MRLRLTPMRAVLVWLVAVVLLGLAPRHLRSPWPLLERDLSRSAEAVTPSLALAGNRDRARAREVKLRNEAHRAALLDSIGAVVPPGLSVDVRLATPEESARATRLLEAAWRSNTAPPIQLSTRVVVRRPAVGSQSQALAEIVNGSCRLAILLSPGTLPTRPTELADRAELGKLLGPCLFAARYGVPGPALAAALPRIFPRGRVPCILPGTQVARYDCRQDLGSGPALKNTDRARWYFAGNGHLMLACAAGRVGACERVPLLLLHPNAAAPGGLTPAPNAMLWHAFYLLPFLEYHLGPDAFGRVWRDTRPVEQ